MPGGRGRGRKTKKNKPRGRGGRGAAGRGRGRPRPSSEEETTTTSGESPPPMRRAASPKAPAPMRRGPDRAARRRRSRSASPAPGAAKRRSQSASPRRRGIKRTRSASASPAKRARRASLPKASGGEDVGTPGPWRKGYSDGQLPEGSYFEGELLSGADLALFRASAVEAHDDSARIEATSHGAVLASTRSALASAFGGSRVPLVHLCPRSSSACTGPVGGRDAVHVPRWRLRPSKGIDESGYQIAVADQAGTAEEVSKMGRSALKERLLALKARLGSEARPAPDPKPSKGGPAPATGPGAVVSRAAPSSGADVVPIAERIASRGKEFAESAGPAHGRRGRSPRRERRTKSRRSRSSGTSSEESAGHGGRRLFRGARTVSERHALRMTERPGDLMATALEEMRRYLVTGQGASSSPGELSPIVRAYLTSVFLPSVGNTISQRNSEELRTLAEASDKILQGDFAGAGDLLLLRFQAIEMAHSDGHWRVARHVMPLSDPRPSASTRALRAAAAQDEARSTRLNALAAQASRGTSPRPQRDGRVG